MSTSAQALLSFFLIILSIAAIASGFFALMHLAGKLDARRRRRTALVIPVGRIWVERGKGWRV